MKIFDNAYYLFFILVLIVDCIIFITKYRKINCKSFRNLGTIITCILSFFILIFVLQTFVPKFAFDAFPLFYLLISSQLILFGWNYFIAGAVNEVINVKESFIEKYGITKREKEIIELIQQGSSNADIARKLFISEKTVANHIYNIYKKLDITSRFELICMFKNY